MNAPAWADGGMDTSEIVVVGGGFAGVWTAAAASAVRADHVLALDKHLRSLADRPVSAARDTVVVIGAGFAGIELATTLPTRLRGLLPTQRVRVVLAEAGPVVGPGLGDGPRPVITAALDEAGVEVLVGRRLVRLDASTVHFADGSSVPTSTVVWTGGMVAGPLAAGLDADVDELGRVAVDRFLRIPRHPHVYAAGDTAAATDPDGHPVLQSCQHAIPLGKYAGHNAANDLIGRPLEPFDPGPYITCLDLGPAGAVLTTGWNRDVRLVGEQAKAIKKAICESYIHPPHNPAELYAMARARPHPELSL
ncbi:MAG TPA: FAD-dependent oxidoreductase [Pseudonocardia sp.]